MNDFQTVQNEMMAYDPEKDGVWLHDGAECGTDYSSPCCKEEGLYAHFLCKDDGSEVLVGFQCTGCGKDYDANKQDEFEIY